jgi:hypothetical protein
MVCGGAIICDSCGITVIPPAMLGGAHVCERCRARHEAYYQNLGELIGSITQTGTGSELREPQRDEQPKPVISRNNYASPYPG